MLDRNELIFALALFALLAILAISADYAKSNCVQMCAKTTDVAACVSACRK